MAINLLTDRLRVVIDPPDTTFPDAVAYLENQEGERYLFQYWDWADLSTPIYQGVIDVHNLDRESS